MRQTGRVHPFVRIMQRYIEDYCNHHDTSVCQEIMAPRYVVHIGGRHHIGRDELYIPAASAAFGNFPDLRLAVHELYTNGDRLVMRFSERGHHKDTGNLACWGGIGLYDWDGERLVENWVEQDYASRTAQIFGQRPGDRLDTPHPDPWATTVVPTDAAVEAVGRAFVGRGDLLAAPDVVIDDSWLHGPASVPIAVDHVEVDDLFSVGDRVAAHVRLFDAAGRFLSVSVILRLEGGAVVSVRAVTDRLALAERG
jgi:predicted ester cyclase